MGKFWNVGNARGRIGDGAVRKEVVGANGRPVEKPLFSVFVTAAFDIAAGADRCVGLTMPGVSKNPISVCVPDTSETHTYMHNPHRWSENSVSDNEGGTSAPNSR